MATRNIPKIATTADADKVAPIIVMRNEAESVSNPVEKVKIPTILTMRGLFISSGLTFVDEIVATVFCCS